MTGEVTFTGQSGKTWSYRTDQPLGSPGGFGSVYAAESPDGMPMAVKVVKKQHPSGALDNRLLRREIDIGRRVREGGSNMLLPVIDAADTTDVLLLVMTRAGDPLSTALPMSEPETIAAMTDIAAGLQDLHSIGIIHRDLKPPNVLSHEGHWKLADFGIARDQEIGTQDPTFTGWGSAPYMAPELWKLKSPTVSTDLYALGCLSFELLTAAPPYTGDQEAIRAAHLTQPPPDVPCGNITLRNLVSRLIAKDPGDRPQDARAVLDRLHRAALPRTPAQEAIARGLGAHHAEKSAAAAREAAAEAAFEIHRQQIAQGKADLREILSDALEELQNVEPDAQLREEISKYRSLTPPLLLVTADVSLKISVWDTVNLHDPQNRERIFEGTVKDPFTMGRRIPDDTMLLAGHVDIANRRHPRALNAANVVYEQVGDRFAWQIYKFRAGMAGPGKYPYGPYTRAHGLSNTWFLNFQERYYMLHPVTHAWNKTIAPLTADTTLELFKEAVDLKPPDPRTGLY